MRFPVLRAAALTALALVCALPVASKAQRQQGRSDQSSSTIRIPFEQYKLPNGLNVILSQDRSTPTVAVNVWYHVGSKNELPGRTGFAHFFEHVMFLGSANAPFGTHDRLTNGVGGGNNGSTNNDRTNYFETVPANYLESTLWLEADRMGFLLLDKLDSATFAAQRDVVKNERRQRTENPPYGRDAELIVHGMYPEGHPYRWPVVGYMTDLEAASLADVKDFFRRYYAPSNATLSVVGDFDPAQAKRWIAKYFSDLPRGKPITRPTVAPPRLASEKRLVFEDRVQVPQLYIFWPAVGLKHDDWYAMEVLSFVLGRSRTARVTKALVYDKQVASSFSAGSFDRWDAMEWGFRHMVPRPGHTLAELELATDSVIERFKREGPSQEEVDRAIASVEFGFVAQLETLSTRADILNQGSVMFGDPAYYRTHHAKIKAVTPADVKRVANTYLGPGRVVLSIVPVGKTDLASKPESSVKVTLSPDGGHYIMGSK